MATTKYVTQSEAQDAAKTYCEAQHQLQQLQGEMNGKISKVQEKYADKITNCAQVSEAAEALLKTFAKEQHPNWEGRKSLDLVHCTIGVRTSQPKVVLPDDVKPETLLHTVAKHFPALIRTEQQLDKTIILSMQGSPEAKKLHDKTGISVEQTENYYVKLKSK